MPEYKREIKRCLKCGAPAHQGHRIARLVPRVRCQGEWTGRDERNHTGANGYH
jgi:hypothetical protein